jgi:lysophospholipase L1-like esterase
MSHVGGKMPVVLWGPYLWTDGEKGRKIDSLAWKQDDTVPTDGTHPSNTGREKVGQALVDFFKSDPTTQSWFLKH